MPGVLAVFERVTASLLGLLLSVILRGLWSSFAMLRRLVDLCFASACSLSDEFDGVDIDYLVAFDVRRF